MNAMREHSRADFINENEITGDTLTDIKERLYDKFKDSYQILNHKQELTGGFLGFGRKLRIRAKYKVLYNKTESFLENKAKILENTKPQVDATLQYALMKKQLEIMGKSISDKMDLLSNSLSIKNVPPSIRKIQELLETNDFCPEYVKNICSKLTKEFPLSQLEDFEEVKKTVMQWIADSIVIPQDDITKSTHVIVLVGPTGVGKTSTISKMAVYLTRLARKLKDDKKYNPRVKMITTDRIRMGAEEQLQKFCDVLGIPLQKAEDSKDLQEILKDRDSYDYVFIDTNGCSPNDEDNIGTTKKMLNVPGVKFDIYLVISADKKAQDIRSIMQNYERFGFNSVIITKLDETNQIGNILSIMAEKQKTFSYIGTGQSITEDFEKATVLTFLSKLADFNIDITHFENTKSDNGEPDE